MYHQATKEVAIGVTNLYPFGTPGEWLLDLNRTRLQDVPAWTTTDRAIGGYIRWDGNETTTGNRGRLFSWSQTVGTVAEERVGTTADGSAMVGDYHGPVFATGAYLAQFPDAYVEVEPNSGAFTMEFVVDGVSMGSQTVNIGSGLDAYGTTTYGTGTYAGVGRQQIPMDLPLNAEGHTIQMKATYTGSAAFRWFTYRIGLIPESGVSGL